MSCHLTTSYRVSGSMPPPTSMCWMMLNLQIEKGAVFWSLFTWLTWPKSGPYWKLSSLCPHHNMAFELTWFKSPELPFHLECGGTLLTRDLVWQLPCRPNLKNVPLAWKRIWHKTKLLEKVMLLFISRQKMYVKQILNHFYKSGFGNWQECIRYGMRILHL